MSDATKITAAVEPEDALQALKLVEGLKQAKEDEERHGCESGVEACEALIEQMNETTAYAVLVGDEQ